MADRSIGVEVRSCRNEVTVVARGYCSGAGPVSCLLLSGQATIILITIEN